MLYRCFIVLFACVALSPLSATALPIFATGQLLIPGDPAIPPGSPGHDDTRENYVFQVDVTTGLAAPVSPVTSGLPAALAGTGDQRLLGFSSGELREIDPFAGTQASIGASNGLSATGFEVLPDGRGYITPFDGNFDTQQLFTIDLASGISVPLGANTSEIGDAVDTAAGNPLGTSTPFIISLGAVGNTLYGVDLDSDSLISLDADTGAASVVGAVGSVGSVGGGAYSGFAALTGVDETADGEFDALFGAVNFFDDPDTGFERLGGIARFDITEGTFSLVGTNPGVIFFGFGSSPAKVPAPSTLLLMLTAAVLYARRGCRRGVFAIQAVGNASLTPPA